MNRPHLKHIARRLWCLFLGLLLAAAPLAAARTAVGDTIVVPAEEWDVFAAKYGLLEADTAAGGADTTTSASLDSCEQAMAASVEKLLADPFTRHAQVGLLIYDLTTGTDVVAHHADYRMRPASTEKLVTTIAALEQLGASYPYRTTLLADGALLGDTLLGNLVVQAGYDPLFSLDDMAAFGQALTEAGLHVITGDVVLDVSMKDTLRWGWGWSWDDKEADLSPLKIAGRGTFVDALKRQMIDCGILLCGRFRTGRVSDAARRLCTREHTVAQVLPRLLKQSNNLYAESLFYLLAASSGKPYAGRAEAVERINSVVRRAGADPTSATFADGSGLSLYNYLSPALLVALLRYAWAQPALRETLVPALPVAGVDGTLQSRMTQGAARGNVRAKTGTVSGVSTLAGYVRAANGHDLCFAILTQGASSQATARSWQDRICQAMAN